MLKNILVMLVMTFVTVQVTGQTVFIPDTQLRAKLNEAAPGLVDVNGNMPVNNQGSLGNQLELEVDWTPADLTGLEYVQVLWLTITFMDGVQLNWAEAPNELSGLTITNYPSNTTWPIMPLSMQTFRIFSGMHSSLPPFPPSITLQLQDLPMANVPVILSGSSLTMSRTGVTSVELTNGGLGSSLDLIANHDLETVLAIGPVSINIDSANTLQSIQLDGSEIITLTNLPALQELNLAAGWTNLTMASVGITHLNIGSSALTGWLTINDAYAMETFTADLLYITEFTGAPLLQHIEVNTVLDFFSLFDAPSLLTSTFHQALAVGLIQCLVEQFPQGNIQEVLLQDCGIVQATIPENISHVEIAECHELISIAPLPSDLDTLYLLYCGSLQELGTLNAGLHKLGILNAPSLTIIPNIPEQMISLGINNSGVRCLPIIPDDLGFLYHDNELDCVPNHPVFTQWIPQPPPLCSILNSNCPGVNPVLEGRVFWDWNENAIQDPGEPGLANMVIRVLPYDYLTGTDQDGRYSIAFPAGTATLQLHSTSPQITSVVPEAYTITLEEGEIEGDLDIAVSIPPYVDVGIESFWIDVARPGFTSEFKVIVQNNGDMPETVSVQIDITPDVIMVGCTSPVQEVDGVYLWQTGSLQAGGSAFNTCTFEIPVTIELGTDLSSTTTVSPPSGDVDPSNNTANHTITVVGSYDPNDKQAFPSTLTPEQGLAGTTIDYLIRFQNTGTWLAERVLVIDTLPAGLQPLSLQFIDASHPCTWFLRDGALHVLYQDIMLPDSTSNEPESHGHALFRISTEPGMMADDQIMNIAGIYFDFNEPIITDPAVLTVVLPTGLPGENEIMLRLFPVPASGAVYLQHDGSWTGAMGRVLDARGRAIRTFYVDAEPYELQRSGLAPGAYILQVSSGPRQWSGTLMFE